MLILGIILFGLLAGWIAQLIMGRRGGEIDWAMALIAGLLGSFVGGLVLSLLFGDGIDLAPSGIIGSILGALIVSFLWTKFGGRTKPGTARASSRRR